MAMKPQSTMSMTSCPECNALCIGPTILPCGHVVCRKCLVGLLAYRGQDPKCPSCLRDILHGKDSRQGVASVLARQFPKDPILETLVDKELEKQDPVPCVGCENNPAVRICTDCAKYFCSQCGSTHRRSEQHELRMLPHELRNCTPASAAASRPSTCSGHRDTNATSFCSIHNSAICLTCVTEAHYKCQVVKINKALEDDKVSFRQQTANLEMLARDLQDCQKQLKSVEEETCNTHQIAERTTRDAFKALRTALDARENKLLEQLSRHATSENGSLRKVMKGVDQKLKIVREYSQGLQDLEDVNVTFSQLQPRLDLVEKECRPPHLPRECRLADIVLDSSGVEKVKREIVQLGQKAQSSGELLKPQPSPKMMTDFDAMTSVPRKTFAVKPDVFGDTHKRGPHITNIVATGDGRLVMTDYNNSKIKVAELTDPANSVRGVKVDTRPYGLALLPDNQVAVTAREKCIYFVDISGQLSVASCVKTMRQYAGVTSVTEDDTLVVGCQDDDNGIACVDVITRAGVVVRTVVDRKIIPDLKWPGNLCLLRGCILVSDSGTGVVHGVELATGRVGDKLTHPELSFPWQVTSDSDGNCYITSVDGQCVLVFSPAGQWRRLLYGPQDEDRPRVAPRGVCVTNTGIVVSWHVWCDYSMVVGYDIT